MTTKNNNENSQMSSLNISLVLNEKNDLDLNLQYLQGNDEDSLNKCCKICMSSEYQPENPMISPCACSGSMKYIHYKCLETWMKNNIEQKISETLWTFTCKMTKCEICKQKFNSTFNFIYSKKKNK